MSTLPTGFAHLILAFAPLFSKRVFQSVQVLLTGAILATGKRTVKAVLRIMGLSQDRHFQTYHRVLNRAVWSSLAASRTLLLLLVRAFAPEGLPVVCFAMSGYLNYFAYFSPGFYRISARHMTNPSDRLVNTVGTKPMPLLKCRGVEFYRLVGAKWRTIDDQRNFSARLLCNTLPKVLLDSSDCGWIVGVEYTYLDTAENARV